MLFDNPAGQSLNIALADDLSGVEYMDVYFGKLHVDSGGYSFTRMYRPDGKRLVMMSPVYVSSGGSAVLQVCFAKYLCAGTTLTGEANGYINFSNNLIVDTNPLEYKLLIYRIEGHMSS